MSYILIFVIIWLLVLKGVSMKVSNQNFDYIFMKSIYKTNSNNIFRIYG